MTPALAYALAGAWICAIGLRGFMGETDPFRRILGANLLGSGIFLMLVALARRAPEGPPDPVPHAMVLTGIVVSVSGTALLLALLARLREEPDADPEAPS